jgi:serine phosphatase RsbU (regulator of sigma subunit)
VSHLNQAFNVICKNAKESETWYVCLMEEAPYYGGPEEGGWWGRDVFLKAYQDFPSETLARAAAEQVEKLAEELNEQEKRADSEACARSMDWLEARGLDADFLPEPDGPSEYRVIVSQGIPQDSRGARHYE